MKVHFLGENLTSLSVKIVSVFELENKTNINNCDFQELLRI